MDKTQIYLDNSATTEICEEALDAYIEASRAHFGNPSSLHSLGHDAEMAIDDARRKILRSLHISTGDIIFTGSGSEANNLAILGRAYAKERFRTGAKIITSMGEHASVNMPLLKLAGEGYKVVKILTRGGAFDLSSFERELTGDTVLVTVMLVNNETGAVYNIPEISAVIKRRCPNAYLHVDATQGYMKIPFSPAVLGADMVTVSAHKIKGPKGIGALYISERVKTERGISPIVFGGGQEGGLRSGTENVPAIVAFGRAAEVGLESISKTAEKLNALYMHLTKRLRTSDALKDLKLVVPPLHASHIANITLPGIKSETMLHYLSSLGIFVSSGSACSSNSSHRSEALIAFGKSEAEADTSIRVSFSDRNELSDVDALIEALESGVTKLARIKR